MWPAHFMRPFGADPASSPFSTKIHPALTSFADDVCAAVARLFAYVGTLALLAILMVHFWHQLPEIADHKVALKPSWTVAARAQPAFALSTLDRDKKSGTYAILRHPDGGRKDILRWLGADNRPVAELEIYRPSHEAFAGQRPAADLAARMPSGGTGLEPAGVIDSKFGTVALFRRENTIDGAGACLGFLKTQHDPALIISGWSCEGDGLPARRQAIACMLDRLTLVNAGNESKLAEFFAHAEPKRRSCRAAGPTATGDWITDANDPHLRGAL